MRTLSGKLSVLMLALFFSFGALSVAAGLVATRMFLDEVNQKVGLPLAQRVASGRVLVRDGRVNQPAIKQLFDAVMAINPMAEMYLLDGQGRILAFSAEPAGVKRTHVSLEPLRRVLAGATLPVSGEDPRNESGHKVFSVAALPEGYLYVILGGQHFDSIVQMLMGSRIARWGAATVALSLLFASVTGIVAFRVLTRPLRTLAHAMGRFQSGEFQAGTRTLRSRRLPDEIDDLASTFDAMSTRIATDVARLKRGDTERREFVANVSHDLRTPLSAVQGYLDTLLMKGDTLDAVERERYLTLALGQSRRVDRMVSELLELSSLERPETTLLLEAFSACDLAQDVVQKFQVKATARDVALDARFEDGLPLASGDIRLVERLLDNLLENALRHTPPAGRVVVTCDLYDHRVRIRVQDTGPGISEEHASRIFERFYRGASGDESGGVGLGLAIGRRIAELHGATLTVDTSPDAGATFSFTLSPAP